MKLLIATPLYPPEGGGPATYSALLEKSLGAKGIEVALAKFSDVKKYPKGIKHLMYFFSVFTKALKADCLLVLDPVSVGLPAVLAGRMLGKKVIVKIVGDYAWEQGQQRAGVVEKLDDFVVNKNVPFLCKFFRVVQTAVARSATAVLVPSNYLKSIVLKWGVDEKKVSVIYNSISLREQIAPSIQLPEKYIVTLGRLVPWKNISGIIDAVSQLSATEHKLPLVVIGEGPLRLTLEKYAKEKASGLVTFTGDIPNEQVQHIIKHSELFVLNSSYEGLSHVLIEALMLGAPVVATDAGGNKELVYDTTQGLLVQVGNTAQLFDAIQQKLTEKEGEGARLERAHTAQVRFSQEQMIENTAAFLKKVSLKV
jgi:glycosyltransferase involved in cell wall biosynthesis